MRYTLKWQTAFVAGHRLFGVPLGRDDWQFGMILSEDHTTIFVGWFRNDAH